VLVRYSWSIYSFALVVKGAAEFFSGIASTIKLFKLNPKKKLHFIKARNEKKRLHQYLPKSAYIS